MMGTPAAQFNSVQLVDFFPYSARPGPARPDPLSVKNTSNVEKGVYFNLDDFTSFQIKSALSPHAKHSVPLLKVVGLSSREDILTDWSKFHVNLQLPASAITRVSRESFKTSSNNHSHDDYTIGKLNEMLVKINDLALDDLTLNELADTLDDLTLVDLVLDDLAAGVTGSN